MLVSLAWSQAQPGITLADSSEAIMTRLKRDLSYFEKRAQEEMNRAQAAEHPAAVQAHRELASYYLDLVRTGATPSGFTSGGSGRTSEPPLH